MPQKHTDSFNLYAMLIDVRNQLGEETASFWGNLEIYNKLNQAQEHIVKKSLCLKKEVTVTTSASTQEYDLKDNSFSDIIDIADDGVTYKINGTTYAPLIYKSKKQLSMEFPGWQGVSASTPKYYYYNKTTKTIGLYPKPNSSNAGAYLYVTGHHTPKILHAGTASSGTTAQIVLPAGSSTLPYPSVTNDYYNNIWIEIYSGTGAGQRVEITDYVGSTRICSASFTTAPDSSSIYGMIPEIPSEAAYLMPLYALWKLWPKAGSRTSLGKSFKEEYYQGLGEFIGEFITDSGDEIVRDSYR